jgi:hypothetical protein
MPLLGKRCNCVTGKFQIDCCLGDVSTMFSWVGCVPISGICWAYGLCATGRARRWFRSFAREVVHLKQKKIKLLFWRSSEPLLRWPAIDYWYNYRQWTDSRGEVYPLRTQHYLALPIGCLPALSSPQYLSPACGHGRANKASVNFSYCQRWLYRNRVSAWSPPLG